MLEPARAHTSCADQLFLRGHRARVARLPVGEPEGLMPNLLSTGEHTGRVKQGAPIACG